MDYSINYIILIQAIFRDITKNKNLPAYEQSISEIINYANKLISFNKFNININNNILIYQTIRDNFEKLDIPNKFLSDRELEIIKNNYLNKEDLLPIEGDKDLLFKIFNRHNPK